MARKKRQEGIPEELPNGVLLSTGLWQVFVSPEGKIEVCRRESEDEEFRDEEELSRLLSQRAAERKITPREAAEAALSAMSEKDPRKALESLWRQQLVKAAIHLETQKFARKPSPDVEKWMEKLKLRDASELGVDLTLAQSKAVFAIQKLLTESDYAGNLKPQKMDGENRFQFWGEAPRIKFSPAQYLEAYGVPKTSGKRGWPEFNRREREEALRALSSLENIQVNFGYRRQDGKGGDVQMVAARSPLIQIMWGLRLSAEDEKRMLADQMEDGEVDVRTTIGIFPCPVFVDQVETYFVMKPSNLHEEIRRLAGGKRHDKCLNLFMEWLCLTAELQRRHRSGWTVRIGERAMASKLRLDSYIRARQWARIRKVLEECLSAAQTLDYLLGYRITDGVSKSRVVELELNPEKYYGGHTEG
jgi:hypothetical protein